MSSVESSTALAPFLSGSSVLESCLAGAFVRSCKFYVYDTCIETLFWIPDFLHRKVLKKQMVGAVGAF